MTAVIKKAWNIGTVFYAYMLAYRAELILWALANSLPFILMGVWMEAATTGTFGRAPEEFARYFLSAFIVRQVTVVWVIWEFEYDVLKGRLSSLLLMPLDPVWRYLLTHIAERFARLPFAALIVTVFFLLYPRSFWLPAFDDAAIAFGLMLLALLLRFIMQYTLAMLAFWTERATSVEQLWMILYLFLSGLIAPLDLFPPVVRDLSLLTPFPYLVYFPAELLVGREVDVGRGLVVMAAWGAAFLALNRALWRAGLKRYSAMGA